MLSNYESMKKQLPSLYDKIVEMDELMRIQGQFLDELSFNTQTEIFNNRFVESLSLNGIEAMERLYEIDPKPSKTLEERRSSILAHKRSQQKLSGTLISQIFKAYTGKESVVTFNNDIGRFYIHSSLGPEDLNVNEFITIMRSQIPQHEDFNLHLDTMLEIVFTIEYMDLELRNLRMSPNTYMNGGLDFGY